MPFRPVPPLATRWRPSLATMGSERSGSPFIPWRPLAPFSMYMMPEGRDPTFVGFESEPVDQAGELGVGADALPNDEFSLGLFDGDDSPEVACPETRETGRELDRCALLSLPLSPLSSFSRRWASATMRTSVALSPPKRPAFTATSTVIPNIDNVRPISWSVWTGLAAGGLPASVLTPACFGRELFLLPNAAGAPACRRGA
mmetsp:Transcript_2262/g.7118  ORF Transcript_2262/g.7118 Transcript_2262/m.7118 type:complete len:201 (+) Transcript_2262:328-930(+)